MIAVGIDCGSKNTKTIVLQDGQIIGKAQAPTGFDQAASVRESLTTALGAARISRDDVERIGAAGAGSKAVEGADLTINDIKAMAVAALHFFPDIRTVVDVGAEGARVARLDDSGKVADFALNEKCAAGAGAFIEAMARALETPIEEMGPLALSSRKNIAMNSQCVIFAESEVVGLIHSKTEKRDISKAIHDAMAGRVASMIRRVGASPGICLLGGVARNPGFVASLERELGVDKLLIPEIPQYAAAMAAGLEAGKAKPDFDLTQAGTRQGGYKDER